MSERVRTFLFSVLWAALVILAVVTLWLGFTNGNIVLIGIAALTTYVVVNTQHFVPLPKVYADRGMTNDIFISKRQQKINQKRKEKLNG